MRPFTLDTSGGRIVGSSREQLVTTPAAGKEWEYLLPSGYWYRVLFGRALLTTSAQVANRSPGFQIKGNDGQIFFQVDPAATLAASTALGVSYAASGPFTTGATSGAFALGLPPAFIPGGFTIASFTNGIQTEDAYTVVRLWLEQVWDEDPHLAAGHGVHDARTLAPMLGEVVGGG